MEDIYSNLFLFLLPMIARAEFTQQTYEPRELVPSHIRHGAILEISFPPKDEVVAAAACAVWQKMILGSPAKYVYDVRPVLVHDHG